MCMGSRPPSFVAAEGGMQQTNEGWGCELYHELVGEEAQPHVPSTSHMEALPSGAQVARLMQIHTLAEAAADAVLLGQALPPAQVAALLQLWPELLRLTAAPPERLASSSPFAAAAHIVLAQRPEASPECGAAASAVSLTLPQPGQQQHQQQGDVACACRFDLLAPPADAAALAELQVFAQQLNRGIEQSSKEALEDTLSELRSSLPCASAVSLVRSSIEDGRGAADVLRHSLRSKLLRRSLSIGSTPEDSLACTPLRTSLSIPPPAPL